jgi:2-succinyl-6-hydroxy-2,4-cyclohexadiene-1-carboxylate synthase
MTGVLLLHGWLGRGADWTAVVKECDGLGAILTPDLPGHGPVGPDGEISMRNAAETMARRLDDARMERAIVAGYSMGGRLALHFALTFPERLAALVLVSTSAGLATDSERHARRRLDARRAAALLENPTGFMRDWYASALFDPLSSARRDALAADRLARGRPAGWAAALEGLSLGAQPWYGDRLDEIRVPVAVLAGAVDAKFTAIARDMAASGNVQCTIVPGAGHALLVERPDAVASVVANVARAATLA